MCAGQKRGLVFVPAGAHNDVRAEGKGRSVQ